MKIMSDYLEIYQVLGYLWIMSNIWSNQDHSCSSGKLLNICTSINYSINNTISSLVPRIESWLWWFAGDHYHKVPFEQFLRMTVSNVTQNQRNCGSRTQRILVAIRDITRMQDGRVKPLTSMGLPAEIHLRIMEFYFHMFVKTDSFSNYLRLFHNPWTSQSFRNSWMIKSFRISSGTLN